MKFVRRIFTLAICMCVLFVCLQGVLPTAYAASDMHVSEEGISFIKAVEGFNPYPYYDYGQYTVGYGTRCPSDKYSEYMEKGITKEEADAYLREFLVDFEDEINRKIIDQNGLTLTQAQYDALVSFSFNLGTSWMSSGTLKQAIVNGADANEIVEAFTLYCKAGGKILPGLVTRRLCEANMYLNAVYSNNQDKQFGHVYYDPNGGYLRYQIQGYLTDTPVAPAADATRSGDRFLGWFTELDGGDKVSKITGELNGKTLFAHWASEENTGSSSDDAVTVKVTGDGVNVRSGPGSNYERIGIVYKNDVLDITHVTYITNQRWGKFEDGWISLSYTNYVDVINGSADDESDAPAGPEEPTLPESPKPQEPTEPEKPEEPPVNPEEPETPTAPETEEPVKPEEPAAPTEPDQEKPEDLTDPVNPEDGAGSNNNESQKPSEDVPGQAVSVYGTVRVSDRLRIRSGPGSGYDVVGYLYNRDRVLITKQQVVGASVWGKIDRGWICLSYVNLDQAESSRVTGTIRVNGLRIRSGPGTSNSVVGAYQKGNRVEIVEQTKVGSVYWGKTNKGWISMDYVTVDSSNGGGSQSGSESQKPSATYKTVTASCLRVRAGAGTSFATVGKLYRGDRVKVLETKTVNGVSWGRIDSGWICMKYTG